MNADEKQEHMKKMGRAWAAWILSFLGIELYAIAKGGGTLSTFIRRFFRVSDKTPLKWSWPAWVLYLILAVLVVHFAVP